VLDTKNPSGVVSVKAGVLTVRYREDPDDGYELPRLASRMGWLARAVETRLHGDGVDGVIVQPVVAIWAPFEQRSVLSGGVAWVSGKQIAEVLTQRPMTLNRLTLPKSVRRFANHGELSRRPAEGCSRRSQPPSVMSEPHTKTARTA
jgi:hypothetical protein